MNVRQWIGFCVVLPAFVVVAAFAQQGQPKVAAMEDHMEHNVILQECAKACSDCQRACDTCATHCAHMLSDGKKEHLATLMACRDCATVCSACAEVCSRGGPFAGIIAEACARICGDCATACEKIPNDKHMKACAEACRNCEKACRAMVQQMTGK